VALYLDDLSVGQKFLSGSVTVTAERIKRFAAEFDPQPFHLDETAAREGVFAGLAASGWHTAALSMRLLVDGELDIAGGLVGLGGEISWSRPVRAGDTLHVESEVLEVRVSASKPGRGIVTVRNCTRNQDGEPVQVFTVKMLVPSRR
jgi:acyl dehydratase